MERTTKVKTDGKHPTKTAVHEAVQVFNDTKDKTGRPEGCRKTTKKEERVIVATLKKVRPPGHGVDARTIHKALPKKLRKKISKRTVIRRLADKGYKPSKKIRKTDPGQALGKRRLDFAKKHQGKSAAAWKAQLQGVADIKEFTYYPQCLRAKFSQLRAPWTYMTKAEKAKPAFVRPKIWFKRADYKKTKKQKVFGLTTSNGKSLALLVPSPWSTEKWATMVRRRVGPFLKRSFPRRGQFQILLDGERLLHGAAAKVAMRDAGISTLQHWPKYSPDLNPQENVWAWAEEDLRKAEKDGDTFEVFRQRVVKSVRAYPAAGKIVGSMAKRMKGVIKGKGAMIKC